MTTKLPLLFGLDRGGTLLHVSQVRKGKKCHCICPECGATLVAYKRDKHRHYFEHNSVYNCHGGAEMALRHYAVQLLEKHGRLRLPPVLFQAGGFRRELQSSQALAVRAMKASPWYNDEPVDVKLTCWDDQELGICFKKRRGKRRRIRDLVKLELGTIEIDLEKTLEELIKLRKTTLPTAADIANGLFSGYRHCRWLFHHQLAAHKQRWREEGPEMFRDKKKEEHSAPVAEKGTAVQADPIVEPVTEPTEQRKPATGSHRSRSTANCGPCPRREALEHELEKSRRSRADLRQLLHEAVEAIV